MLFTKASYLVHHHKTVLERVEAFRWIW